MIPRVISFIPLSGDGNDVAIDDIVVINLGIIIVRILAWKL